MRKDISIDLKRRGYRSFSHNNEKGIAAPLIMRKTDAGAGQVVMGSALPASSHRFDFYRTPSQVIVLYDACGRADVDDELEEEMAEEASKYGKVLACKVAQMPMNWSEAEAVRIFLHFNTPREGEKAKSSFTGRKFGGRSVKVLFYPVERFQAAEYQDKP